MNSHGFHCGGLLVVWLLLVVAGFAAAPVSTESASTLEVIRKRHHLPALAVIVLKDGKICERAAVGVRKDGDLTPVTIEDQFHIGSCTKSMTATLAAKLIEEGKLKWETTVAEVFPELKGKMDKQFETVTLEQLLMHRGGVPAKPPSAAWLQAWKEQGTPTQQRRKFIEAILRQPPEAAPNTKFIYSNQGYALAGAMLEKVMGQSWETLISEKLFTPLKMKSAGFGAPGAANKVDQPWGHERRFGAAIPSHTDNPPAIAPAGRVYCSLDDLAKYTLMHLRGEKEGGFLKTETFRKLHTPPEGQDYACGWAVVDRSWASGKAFTHSGSNTMWFLTIWFAPGKDFAVISATNIADTDAENACDEAASQMIIKWLK